MIARARSRLALASPRSRLALASLLPRSRLALASLSPRSRLALASLSPRSRLALASLSPRSRLAHLAGSFERSTSSVIAHESIMRAVPTYPASGPSQTTSIECSGFAPSFRTLIVVVVSSRDQPKPSVANFQVQSVYDHSQMTAAAAHEDKSSVQNSFV